MASSEAGLSALARLLKKGKFEEFDTGEEGPKLNAMLPAKSGRTRGSIGSTGARPLRPLQTRNPDAAEDEDRQIVQGPIMQAFLTRVTA